MVMLDGGADSFNMVVSHTCTPNDLYTEYTSIRGGSVALSKDQLLQIEVPSDSDPQPCSVFGLHPSLAYWRDAYVDKDAMIVNNIGA